MDPIIILLLVLLLLLVYQFFIKSDPDDIDDRGQSVNRRNKRKPS